MATLVVRKDEYATSTDRVRDLRRWKDELYQRSMPKAQVQDLVDHYFRRPAYAHLAGKNPVFMVAPSTTGANKLPYYFAKRLQSEFSGQVIPGWATPLVREKASLKGGLGKMRNPARFAAVDDRLAKIPKSSTVVLVDDVVTTGETADALRELLEQRGLKATTVASLGQSEMRKVSPRDIERITSKLGNPDIGSEIEAVLAGRLKHKANYIERAIHDDTRNEIRDYFGNEHRRLQGLGAVHPGADRSLRGSHSSDPGLQFQGSPETGDSGESEQETGTSSGHATGQRDSVSQAKAVDLSSQVEAELVFQLEELREMVRRGMSVDRAREYGLAALDANKMQPAPRMLVNYELSQALKNEPGAKPMNEIVQFAREMDKPVNKNQIAPHRSRRVG